MDELDAEQILFMTPLQSSYLSEPSPSNYADLDGSFSQMEYQQHMSNFTRELQVVANQCYALHECISESDTHDQQPTEATDDGTESSQRPIMITSDFRHAPSLGEGDEDGIAILPRSDPLDESFASVSSDTGTILVEEELHHRPVFNYSRSLCLAYTAQDDDQLAIQKAVDESSDISLDFQGIAEEDDCCKSELGHVMISCDDTTKDICLRIATYLKSHNYDVWFDRQHVPGNVFGSMASAVENSFVILMAINEAYNQCRYCRLEAEYSMEQNKISIPMLMQAGYRPQGWLGIINGAKLHIDFSQLPFDQACQLLVREIEAVRTSLEVDAIEQSVLTPVNNQATTMHGFWPSPQNAQEWSANDVVDWLHREKLEAFEATLTCFTGATLRQLYKVKLDSPTEYYRMVETLLPAAVPLRLFHILHFNAALDNLFLSSVHKTHR